MLSVELLIPALGGGAGRKLTESHSDFAFPRAKGPFGMGLSVSPDGRFVLFAQGEQTASDLMLIENLALR